MNDALGALLGILLPLLMFVGIGAIVFRLTKPMREAKQKLLSNGFVQRSEMQGRAHVTYYDRAGEGIISVTVGSGKNKRTFPGVFKMIPEQDLEFRISRKVDSEIGKKLTGLLMKMSAAIAITDKKTVLIPDPTLEDQFTLSMADDATMDQEHRALNILTKVAPTLMNEKDIRSMRMLPKEIRLYFGTQPWNERVMEETERRLGILRTIRLN